MPLLFEKAHEARTGTCAALGEIMLRLAAPGYEKFFQSPELKARFGGGESNVLVSLAIMGMKTRFLSALPDNAIGRAALHQLRGFGIDTDCVVQKKNSRMGLYFLERGANQRPSAVIYDREGSVFSLLRSDEINWKAAFDGVTWFHITGIAPALSETAAALSFKAVEEARRAGAVVSIDLNYRAKLWKYGKTAQDVVPKVALLADVIIANEEGVQKSLGIGSELDPSLGEIDRKGYEELAGRVFEKYKSLSLLAITLRESFSASHNRWSACISDGKETVFSRTYDITDIVDRVGGGDSFAAGLIYGLTHLESPAEALDFAVAASCLNHSIEGDVNLSTLDEIMKLYGGDATGRINR